MSLLIAVIVGVCALWIIGEAVISLGSLGRDDEAPDSRKRIIAHYDALRDRARTNERDT